MLDYIVLHYFRELHRFPSGVGEILVGLPIVLVVCMVYWFCRRKWHKKRLGADFAETRRKCRLNEIVRLLFVAWFTMMFLLCLTTDMDSLVRNFSSPLILVPAVQAFRSFTSFNYVFSLFTWGYDRDMLLNTVLFIPLGAALPILWKKANFGRTTLVGFMLTYFIELRAQPFLDRNPGIDDLICNTLGAVIGYLLFMLIRKLFPKFIEACQRTIKIQSTKRKAQQNV